MHDFTGDRLVTGITRYRFGSRFEDFLSAMIPRNALIDVETVHGVVSDVLPMKLIDVSNAPRPDHVIFPSSVTVS